VGLAGTAIVAGPWLLSVLGIFLIQRFASGLLSEAPALFTAVIVYSYAFSLIAASGFHYIFTRWISDLIYEKKTSQAGGALLSFLLLTAAGSLILGAVGVLPLSLTGTVANPRLFSAAAILLFVVINLNWVLMSFVSLLKAYVGILLVYLGGSLASFAGVIALGRPWATAGAVLGYALGQCLTAVVLYGMTLARYRPAGLPFKGISVYLARYRFLFLSGTLYAWATWADKAVFWFAFGKRVPGAWLSVFDAYDVPVFFSMLTLIPALIYFTIEVETAFYPRLRDFLQSLSTCTRRRIQEKKYTMIRAMYAGLREQALLQFICTAATVLLAPAVAAKLLGGGTNIAILRVTLAAVFFHSLFLSLMIFCFYFELYSRAFVSTSVFFGVNLLSSLYLAWSGRGDLAGASYLLGGIAGSVTAALFLARSSARIDKILYVKSSRA
jgi:uncharacterized membrane protein